MPTEPKPATPADAKADEPVAAPLQTRTESPVEPSLPYEEYRARKALDAQTQAREMKMDQAPEGGRYLAEDGKTVLDANGQVIKDKE